MKKTYLSCAVESRKEVSDKSYSAGFVFQARKTQDLNSILDQIRKVVSKQI
jgi:hypothetical protein